MVSKWSEAFILAFGFVTGASMVAYLVLSDPEIRMMFKAKSNRISGAGWQGIAKESARQTVMELREAFPDLFKRMVE